MKNKLADLNDHLFAQMERLSEEGLDEKKIETEIIRSKAISSIAANIINNAKLVLDAQKYVHDMLLKKPPAILGIEGYKEEKDEE